MEAHTHTHYCTGIDRFVEVSIDSTRWFNVGALSYSYPILIAVCLLLICVSQNSKAEDGIAFCFPRFSRVKSHDGYVLPPVSDNITRGFY
eukprot:scaffold100531_cov56-Attheya_sp.AAC.6